MPNLNHRFRSAKGEKMKKLLILMVAIMLPNMANADGQCARYYVEETCSSSYTYTVYGNTDNASTSTTKCFGLYENMTPIGSTTPVWTLNRHVKVITSLTCKTGYSRTSAGTLSMCMDDPTGDNTQSLTYYKCVCADQYVWNLDWASYNVAIERQSGTLYNCGSSSTVYQYRCASGYYSASGNATMLSLAEVDCVSCSSTCGVGHTTGVAGATSYEQCRAPAATEFTDDVGTFEYSTACCCDDTCDAKCGGGQSCASHSDCASGSCLAGCCVSINCGTGGTACITDDDCPLLKPTCTNGCCTRSGSIGTLTCTIGSAGFCLSDSDCDSGSCDTSTNCCGLSL